MDGKIEIEERLQANTKLYYAMIFNNKELKTDTKVRILHIALCLPTLTYELEMWTVNKQQRRIQGSEMKKFKEKSRKTGYQIRKN